MSEQESVNITVRARIYENDQPRIVEMAVVVPVHHMFDPHELEALIDSDFFDAVLEDSLQNDVVAPAKTVMSIEKLNAVCPRQRYCNQLKTDTPCSVCQQEFKIPKYVRKLPCQHMFCSTCIEQWATKHSATCPVCRASFSTSYDDI